MPNHKGLDRQFGSIRQLSSGRFQARYPGPDGLVRTAPKTFATDTDAARWLTMTEAEMIRGGSPEARLPPRSQSSTPAMEVASMATAASGGEDHATDGDAQEARYRYLLDATDEKRPSSGKTSSQRRHTREGDRDHPTQGAADRRRGPLGSDRAAPRR
jgi:hypothetical protein